MVTSPLFTPFRLHNLKLANRLVMAPMTRNRSPQHVPTPEAAAYYQRRAKASVGLIITEGTAINHPASHGYPDVPNFYGEKALAGWKTVVNAVHAAGGKIFPQLWHVGSVRQKMHHENLGVDNPSHCCDDAHSKVPGYGPSAIQHPYVPNAETPQALEQSDIDALIQAYAAAAVDAKRLGFDGVELHGAHGYLIDQFFWSVTNKRSDTYGGATTPARTRFAVEVIEAVRAAVGPDFPISFRLSQWKLGDYNAKMVSSAHELETFLIPLTRAGVDIFHCSTRRFFEPEFPGSPLNLAGWVKKLSGKPTITVGSVGLDNDFINFRAGETAAKSRHSLEDLMKRFLAQEFDLIAVGRMLLADPNWVEKLRLGQFSDMVTFTKEHLDRYY